MKHLIITCDWCKREYEYKDMEATNRYPQPTQIILNKEYCRMCIKKILGLINK